MDFPKRKQNRLPDYDYSTPNAYFITICTDKRKPLFWAVGAASGRPQAVPLSERGRIVDRCISSIPMRYPAISVDQYVIMPNHIHLLLQIHAGNDGRPVAAPTVSQVVNQFKGAVSKQIGQSVWQKGFHDHVIRTEADYRDVWNYIENNPFTWKDDNLFME